eukprot:m.80193 g.80193  ORF g.80193 m.80193 type:complete len:291 (-) comp8028_c0_seq2:153-1025(-)
MASSKGRRLQVWDAADAPGGGQAFKKKIVLMPGHFAEYDPFLLMAEDWMQAPGGFRDHPHRGFETVTLVLDGACRHKDSHGNEGVLRAGDVQWMTAGSGVIHSEMPEGTETCHLLQLWLNLPAAQKMMAPRYQDIRAADMPRVAEPGVTVRVISGAVKGAVSPTLNVVDTLGVIITIEPGSVYTLDIPPGATAFSYVLAGEVQLHSASAHVTARAGQVALLAATKDLTETTIRVAVAEAVLGEAMIVLFAAKPLREPVCAEGPFVMSKPEEIAQAHRDYLAGVMGPPGRP